MPVVCNDVCSCQFSRAPRAACKAILQLSCWRQTAFHSPHYQIPSAARFSSLSLGKPEGLSPVRWRAPRFINNRGWGAARLSACWELPKRCRGRCFGECSTATVLPQPPLPGAPRLLLPLPLPLHRAAPLRAEPQPSLAGDALWPLPGVAVTTALTPNCVGRSFISGEDAWNAGASSA